MHQRFLDFALMHGADPGTAEHWWRQLETRYADRRRRYHTLRHIGEMLDLLPHADETVLAAVWFHDAVYLVPDAEERSAELARAALQDLSFDEETVNDAVGLILATKTHDPSQIDPRFHTFLDADLAILGSAPARYDEYARQVRQEYGHVPQGAFRSGRAAVLRSFLARPFLYATEEFRARFEHQARANIARELSA